MLPLQRTEAIKSVLREEGQLPISRLAERLKKAHAREGAGE